MKIIKINNTQTITVRHAVLRQGKPIESCFFDGDTLASTFHVGAQIDNTIIGVVSVFKNNSAYFNNEKLQFQLRGMAILENFQKKGIGEKLIQFVEQETLKNNTQIIWFNARESAVPFYKKMNYQIIGNSFQIESIGTHFVMYKKIGSL